MKNMAESYFHKPGPLIFDGNIAENIMETFCARM